MMMRSATTPDLLASRSSTCVPSPQPQKWRRRGTRGPPPPSSASETTAPANERDVTAALDRSLVTTPTTNQGRRQALLRLGGLGLAAAAAAASSTAPAGAARAAVGGPAPPSSTTAACQAGVRFDLASAILKSAYAGFDAAVESNSSDDARSRRDALRSNLRELRRREYGHYSFEGPTREGERQRAGYIPPPPPSRYGAEVAPLLAALEAEEGGEQPSAVVVPPAIFDFALWSLLKAIAAELPPSQAVGGARSVLNAETGRNLARAVGGDLLKGVRRQRASSSASSAVAPFAAVADAIQQTMDRLTEGGYCCAWQVTYGDQPGSWPSDWPVSEPKINGDPQAEAARTLDKGDPLLLQLRVARPADVGASVALRNEEWGFCARLVAGVFAAFLEAGGYGALVSATVGARSPAVVDACDVYYSQDTPMKKPSSLRDQVLLALGDPMTEVVVAFNPDAEVLSWSVVVPSAVNDGAKVVAVGPKS